MDHNAAPRTEYHLAISSEKIKRAAMHFNCTSWLHLCSSIAPPKEQSHCEPSFQMSMSVLFCSNPVNLKVSDSNSEHLKLLAAATLMKGGDASTSVIHMC